jgi:hypothetical protein
MNVRNFTISVCLIILMICSVVVAFAAERSPMIDALRTELDRSFAAMQDAGVAPLYYMRYQVTDLERFELSAQ